MLKDVRALEAGDSGELLRQRGDAASPRAHSSAQARAERLSRELTAASGGQLRFALPDSAVRDHGSERCHKSLF